jgi:hypothetical protein
MAISPLVEYDSSPGWFELAGGCRVAAISGPDGDVSIGSEKRHLDKLDRLEITGRLHVWLEFVQGRMPCVEVDGTARSAVLNGAELLTTRWGAINPNVRGGLLGGFVGFLASLIVQLVATLVRKPRHERT